MSKVAVSVSVAILLGGALVAGLIFLPSGPAERPEVGRGGDAELAAVRETLDRMREDLQAMNDTLGRLESSQKALAAAVELRPIAAAEGAALEGSSSDAGEGSLADLRGTVSSVLQEERKIREEEQQQRREEFRQRMEERRKEREELSQGPYDRLNLKVNSMAKVLGLTDAQRDGYHELIRKYSDKFAEARRGLSGQEGAQGETEGGGPRRGGPGRGREQFRELVGGLQKEFEAELGTVLTASQLETYQGLSGMSQSFMSTGMVSASGEGEGRMGDFFGGGMRGMRGGGRGR